MHKKLCLLVLFLVSSASQAAPSLIETYDGGLGRTLRYLVRPDTTSVNTGKLFVFLNGDGESCAAFDPTHFERLAAILKPEGTWIVPETAKEALCSSGEYRKLDFFHRVTEVKNLVGKLQADTRFSEKRFFLVSISGGAKIAMEAMHDLPVLQGVVFINGVSANLETMFYDRIISQGATLGSSAESIALELSKQREIFLRVQRNCTIDEVTWTDRCNLFWCQMLTGDSKTTPANFPLSMRYLVIHGLDDKVVPAQVGIHLYSEMIAAGKNADIKLYRGEGHTFYNFMSDAFLAIQLWSQ